MRKGMWATTMLAKLYASSKCITNCQSKGLMRGFGLIH